MSWPLLSDQTSGDRWSQPGDVMLHERTQPGVEIVPIDEDSVFESLEHQMAQQESEFADAVTRLRREFIFVNAAPVRSFLKAHRALASVLLEATAPLRECFGVDTPLALEIAFEDGPATAIYALAIWAGDASESRAALNRFDEIWWMDNLGKAGRRIVFDYELI